MSRDNYIYASAKVRSLESYLPTEADLTRVIDAKNPDIAFKAFNSLDYAGELLDLEAKDYRTAMDRKMSRLKKVLERIVPEDTLRRLLFLERDYYNIKILFKEKVSGTEFEAHLETSPGLIPVGELRRYIIDELDADIDPVIKQDINVLKNLIGEDADPETIENLVDQALNRENFALAKKLGNPFVTKLYQLLADKNNINRYLRARNIGKPKTWFAERVSSYGQVSASQYLDNYEAADDTEFVSRWAANLGSTMAPYVEEYLKDKEIWHIELGMNNVIMEHLKGAKIMGYGPEVIVAYYFAKKFAVKNLATIMALKFGEVEPSEIRKHLVNSYTLA